MPRQNLGADSGAAATAALIQELQAAQAKRQVLTVPEVVDFLRRRGFTKDAIGFALLAFEKYTKGRFEGSEKARREVRHDLRGIVPPSI